MEQPQLAWIANFIWGIADDSRAVGGLSAESID